MKFTSLFAAFLLCMLVGLAVAAQPAVFNVSPRPVIAPASPGPVASGTFTISGNNLFGANVTTDGPLALVGPAQVNNSGTTLKQSYVIGCCAPFEGQTFLLFVNTASGSAVIQDSITLNPNALPTITGVSPSPISPGIGTLTITGSGFSPDYEIFTDGQTTLLTDPATSSPDGTSISRPYNIWCCNAGNATINFYVTNRINNYSVAIEVPYQNPPPSVSLVVSPPAVPEDGSGTLNYTFVRNTDTGPLTVNFAASGTATSLTDYVVFGGPGGFVTFSPAGFGTITFAPGSMAATVIVDPISDTNIEPNETVVLTVTPGPGYSPAAPASATGTIINDDLAPPPSITISDVTMAEGDSGVTQFTFTITRSGSLVSPTIINYSTADGTATGGLDYQTIAGTAFFAPGVSSFNVSIPVTGDTAFEADETFFLNLVPVFNGNLIDSQGVGTILNDDPYVNLPANKDACKNGGWETLTRSDGSLFKNQGDCVSYVNNGK